MALREEMIEVVRAIPLGSVMGYGQVGRRLSQRVSGLVVGGWLDKLEPGSSVPWWRVVGAGGALLTARKDPAMALLQQELLEREGVLLDQEGRVAKDRFVEDL